MLLFVAALTSTISISEVSVAFVQKQFHKSRLAATLIMMTPLFVISSLCSMSFGPLEGFKIFGDTLFNFLDNFTTNIVLPLTALTCVIFVGWFAPKGTLRGQLTNDGAKNGALAPAINFIIRYPAPIIILAILISGLLK